MSLKPCPRCGKLFSNVIDGVCKNCLDYEEECFDKVSHYVRENPYSTAEVIAEETEVSKTLILKFIREGRLIPTEGLKGAIKCHRCSKPISAGKYCEKCATNITQKIHGVTKQKPENTPLPSKKSAKMHIDHRDK